MAKTWLALAAAVAISAAAFTHSTPAAAQQWVAPGVAAASPCCGAFHWGGNCCDDGPRGLFTSGFFGGCGCDSWHGGYGPASHYTEPYSYPNYSYPYLRPWYRHGYHPYLRHGLYRHGVYHRYGAYHGHGVYHHGHVYH